MLDSFAIQAQVFECSTVFAVQAQVFECSTVLQYRVDNSIDIIGKKSLLTFSRFVEIDLSKKSLCHSLYFT